MNHLTNYIQFVEAVLFDPFTQDIYWFDYPQLGEIEVKKFHWNLKRGVSQVIKKIDYSEPGLPMNQYEKNWPKDKLQ